MDFIYSSNESQADRIAEALSQPPADKPIAHNATGPWGAFVATDAVYWGYSPAVDDGELFCVVGDPLASGVVARKWRGSDRTLGIARKWKADAASVEPNHPAALFWARALPEVRIITDAWGAVSLYYGVFGGDLYVATSPDLIALCVDVKVDRLSVRELLASTQIAFPNTLFKGISQIPPASHVTLTCDGIVSSRRYWNPPLPVEGVSVAEWAERLHESIAGTFKRIRAELGQKGSSTLSAGLDSRYLVAVATRDKLLDVDGITISPIRNQEFWIAKRAAHLLGVTHKSTSPPAGGYGARMLANSPVIPSHIDREHAHFANHALGDVASPFLLGGYMADTILKLGNPFYTIRCVVIEAKDISGNAPQWAVTSFSKTLDRKTTNAISQRWRQSDELLGITERHEPTLVTAYPATRQGHIAHFEAARREYPIYEAFMTRTALNLGFEIPIEAKKATPKYAFYLPYLNGLLSGLLSPGASESLTIRIWQRFQEVPVNKRPRWAQLVTAWGSVGGPSHAEYVKERKRSFHLVESLYGGDYRTVRRQLCFQIAGALDIAGRNATPRISAELSANWLVSYGRRPFRWFRALGRRSGS